MRLFREVVRRLGYKYSLGFLPVLFFLATHLQLLTSELQTLSEVATGTSKRAPITYKRPIVAYLAM